MPGLCDSVILPYFGSFFNKKTLTLFGQQKWISSPKSTYPQNTKPILAIPDFLCPPSTPIFAPMPILP